VTQWERCRGVLEDGIKETGVPRQTGKAWDCQQMQGSVRVMGTHRTHGGHSHEKITERPQLYD
jgi:hypothetical protein